MNKKQIRENSIILIGPSCVGKTLISEELSSRTQMPVFSVDDILFFLAEMRNNGLKNTNAGRAKYKRLQQHFAYSYKPIKITRHDKEKTAFLNESIDNLIEKYQAYDEYFDLKQYKRFYEDYWEVGTALAETDISDEFIVFISQAYTTALIQDIIDSLDTPAIIDVSAPDGWYTQDYKPNKHDQQILDRIGYKFEIEESLKSHHQIFSNFGQKVFLFPGEDYKERKTTEYEGNNLLVDNLDKFYNYADLMISVNGLFNEPDNPVFKRGRYYIDVNGIQTKNKLLNRSEVSSICEQIIDGLADLKAYQKI